MQVALDANILVYAENVKRTAADAPKVKRAVVLLPGLAAKDVAVLVPAQALGELYNVLTRKAGVPGPEASVIVSGYSDLYPTLHMNDQSFTAALRLAATHRLAVWDAIILHLAATAGCRLLLSEDMQAGFVWRGCEVVNPFIEVPHPLLARALGR